MTLLQILNRLQSDPHLSSRIATWKMLPARSARTAPLPDAVNPGLARALRQRGIESLYSHQAEAFRAAHAGEHLVVVTPTASGKTLCYNLPVLNRILTEPNARALYLFPTKALSADQVDELQQLVHALHAEIKTFTYDGDTPASARRAIRAAGHIVVTNPDMLHTAILPHHTKWLRLFENLRYVIIDELHQYRGVFGSHVANVIRRLSRICRFYGSDPQFISTSATIGNPQEHAERLIGRPVTLIDQSGAPAGEKVIAFINPPVVHRELGIRRDTLLEVRDLASELIRNQIPTITFGRSRLAAELLTTYFKDLATHHGRDPKTIRATGPATCRQNAGRSSGDCARETFAPSPPPTRWNWASTSASSPRRFSPATPAQSPPPGSRWDAPAAAANSRRHSWWPPAILSTST